MLHLPAASGSERYAALRQRHRELVYERFAIAENSETFEFTFEFSLADGPLFRPTLSIPKPPAGTPALERGLLENLAFHVGLVELISYWKAACPPVVRIRAGRLDAAQQAWWKNLWFHGLGEFFYLNGIVAGADDFLTLVGEGGPVYAAALCAVTEESLVPVGGGKDSLVTLRLMESRREGATCFFLNRTKAQAESARLLGYGPEGILAALRTLDPALLELNRRGYLNGHTPFSALLAFVSLLTAALHGKRYIVLSNESSASEPTVHGSEVNHQYSKGWAFEEAFTGYAARYLTPSIRYFSLLRPWNELQIARRFAADPGAWEVFRSCNVGSKEDRWCGHCAKCLFVDILLAPFLDEARRRAVFGNDKTPLDRPELRPEFEQLIGIAAAKPFECVGTVEEVRAALTLAAERLERLSVPRPVLLDEFVRLHSTLRVSSDRIGVLLEGFHEPHGVPESFLSLLQKQSISK